MGSLRAEASVLMASVGRSHAGIALGPRWLSWPVTGLAIQFQWLSETFVGSTVGSSEVVSECFYSKAE